MLNEPKKAPLKLHVVVVGCGIAGLTSAYALGRAGHRVTVVECAPLLADVGAGIQVGPNMARILIRWGLRGELERLGVRPGSINFRRYESDELVGLYFLGDDVEKQYGMPYWNVHRADLLRMLYNVAKPFIKVVQDHVTSVSTSPAGSPYITTQTGRVIHADIVIGADGIKSVVRSFVVQQQCKPIPTGDLAYRVVIPTEAFEDDPLLRPLVEDPRITYWMGPHKHIVGYCVSSRKMYNLVLIRPDTNGTRESWSAEANIDEVRATYEGWNPRVTRLLGMVEKGIKSRLVAHEPLRTWVHPNGRVALIGDSCHSMLPYLAQGAAMAVEDAAVLGALFSRITSRAQIRTLLKAYESLRLPRTTNTQIGSRSNQGAFHLPDGPEQRMRDQAMRSVMEETLRKRETGTEGAVETKESNKGDRVKANQLYAYDPAEAVDEWYRSGGHRVYHEQARI